MLYSTRTPSQKRQDLRSLLRPGAAVQFPGAFTPLSTRLIQEHGFSGIYLSGAVIANELGLPDIGLTTLTEVAQRGRQIARSTDLPCLIDADTGFGEPMNVARTIQELEDAGLAGCHIEDQVNPKRCGHLDGKAVVDDDTAAQRIRAAADARRDGDFLVMARTDLRAGAGLPAAIDRMKMLVDAGADAIFPEAMADLSEFEAVCEALDVPVLANMTEFGKSALFTRDQLADAGVAMVIYPVTLLRTAMGAIDNVLGTISAEGSQAPHVDEMLTRSRLYELVDYEDYNRFDTGIFDFEVPTAHQDRSES
ncbi:methylisocitrate lyase [Brachybacterium endophyticum]|uniref:Methylisocitrate lyase n=1 Tax=Brachybacterium endophyticum TaxID=2182385 RepID=A0A2U2RM09_9MICO|nr:methylisocitrate lyase [Brachybacterium endophyticum]PWH06871.1 methylisocitrate lyase [Brachybacterium endophyticum]